MKTIVIKTNEIEATTIIKAMTEISIKYPNEVKQIASLKNWALGDTLEAIATHIIYTDTDYTL